MMGLYIDTHAISQYGTTLQYCTTYNLRRRRRIRIRIRMMMCTNNNGKLVEVDDS
jgi:hypothetical protein